MVVLIPCSRWLGIVGLDRRNGDWSLALVMLLALFEYFALGDAIGHPRLPFLDSLMRLDLGSFTFNGWLANMPGLGYVGMPRLGILTPPPHGRYVEFLFSIPLTTSDVFFVFLLGVAALTLLDEAPDRGSVAGSGIAFLAACSSSRFL